MAVQLGSMIYAGDGLDAESRRSSILDHVEELLSSLDGSDRWCDRGGFLGAPPEAQGGRAPSIGRSGPADVGLPPAVTRGANPQVRVEVGLDWLRLSGPAYCIPMVRAVLEAHFGKGEPGKALFLYTSCEAFHGGVVRLLYDVGVDRHASKITVEVPGGALARFGADGRVELLRDLLAEGLQAVRIDVAVDLVNPEGGVNLVESVEAACQVGELVGARRYRIIGDKSTRGRLKGLTVGLGARGDEGSGRYVRAYDKGLEMGLGVPNTWQRWEVEFSRDVAAYVAQQMAGCAEWVEGAVTFALGAVEFRTVTGARDASRRPKAAWWCQFVDLVRDQSRVDPQRVKARRVASSLVGWRAHQRRALLPTVDAMARLAGCSMVDVFADLCKGYQARRLPKGPVIAEYSAELDLNGGFDVERLSDVC